MDIVTISSSFKSRDFALPLDRTDIENEFGMDKIVLSQNNIIISLHNVKPSEKYDVVGDLRGGSSVQQNLTNVLISKSDTFHEGFLTKKGKIIKSWKKRWFVIHRGEMSYYKKQIQQSSGGKSKKPSHVTGSFTVEKCLCGPVQLMSDTKEFAFRITTPKRSYCLVAANAQEFEIWKEKIKLNGGKWHDEKATVLIKEDGSIQIQSNAPLRTISKNQISGRRRNSGTAEISLPIEKKVNFIPTEIEKDSNKFEEKDDMTFFFNKKTGIDFVDIHKGFNKEIKQKSSSPNDVAIRQEAKKTNSYEDTSDKVFNQSDEVDLTEDYSSSEGNHTIEELIPSLTLEEKKIPKAIDEEIGTFFIGKNSVDMKIINDDEKDKEPKEVVEFPTFVLHRGLDVELK